MHPVYLNTEPCPFSHQALPFFVPASTRCYRNRAVKLRPGLVPFACACPRASATISRRLRSLEVISPVDAYSPARNPCSSAVVAVPGFFSANDERSVVFAKSGSDWREGSSQSRVLP